MMCRHGNRTIMELRVPGSLPWQETTGSVEWVWLMKLQLLVRSPCNSCQSLYHVTYSSYHMTGVRLFSDQPHTDIMEGLALSHSLEEVEVFSNSWGPVDNGALVEGLGPLANKALLTGVTEVQS